MIRGNLYSVNKQLNIWNNPKMCVLPGLWSSSVCNTQMNPSLWGLHWEIFKDLGCQGLLPLICHILFPFLMGWSWEILKCVFSCCFSPGSHCLVHCTNFPVLLYGENIQYLLFFLIQGIVPWFIYTAQFKSIFIPVLVFSSMAPESFITTNECIFALCWNEVPLNPFKKLTGTQKN